MDVLLQDTAEGFAGPTDKARGVGACTGVECVGRDVQEALHGGLLPQLH
jgi:hypothetical protein